MGSAWLPDAHHPGAWWIARPGWARQTSGYHILRVGLFLACFVEAAVGCASPPAPAVITSYSADSVPTAVYLTAEAINSGRLAPLPALDMRSDASQTAAPVATLAVTPTVTSVAGPDRTPAAIQILAPGPLSRVISPLQIQLVAVAGASRTLDVDLFGHDWRLLGHSLQSVAGSPAGDPLSLSIRFEIRSPSEDAFLQVSTRDGQGRVQSQTTLPIVLSSSGNNQINAAGSMIFERVDLHHPEPGVVVSGGLLTVQGDITPYKRHPVIVELIADDGRNLGLRVLTFVGTDWQSFKTTVPYRVRGLTPARLYVRQADDTLGDQAYIFSQEITLEP